MSTGTPVMAPRWGEQPSPPPTVDRNLITPAARALMRASNVALDDLGAEPGAVVRLAQVIAAQRDTKPATEPGEREIVRPAAGQDTRQSMSIGLESTVAESTTISGCVVSDAVLEGDDTVDLRLGRLLRAAAAALRPTGPGAPISASVTVLTAEEADPEDDSTIVIDDVGSLDVDALARRVADRQGIGSADSAPRLAVLDATRLDVRRLDPAALAEVTVTVATPVARVVPFRIADGTQVIAIRDVSEITVRHVDTVTPALAARIATASALAFSRNQAGTS